MLWLAGVVVVALLELDRRQRRREREDLERPGLPARRTPPRRGVGALGEAPPTIHHRLGGLSSRD